MARIIRGMSASSALDTLRFVPRKAARILRKTLQSAIANAEKNADLDVNDLVVKTAVVGTGPTIKRGIAVARGSWHPILKRTSHLKIVLSDEGAAKRLQAEARAKTKTEKARAKPTAGAESKPEAAQSGEQEA